MINDLRWFRSCIGKTSSIGFEKLLDALKNCNYVIIQKFLENENNFLISGFGFIFFFLLLIFNKFS
jgi:hypothetical protein